jgi:hypothetical protein
MSSVSINNIEKRDSLTIANAFNNYFVILDRKISLQYLKRGKVVPGTIEASCHEDT